MNKGIFQKAYMDNLPKKQNGTLGTAIDPSNMDKLVEEHAPLIKYIAHRIAKRLPPHIEVDDLVGSGVLGLIDAIGKFDPTRGAQFKTYAEFRIRGAIMDELRSLDWVPRSVRQKVNQLQATSQKLEHKLGRAAADDEVAEAMGVDMEEYHSIVNYSANMPLLSLDDIGLGLKEDRKSLLDCLAGSKDANPQTHVRLVELKKTIAEAIDSLPEKERLMISLYYYEELTMKEIGAVLEITESRVSQIHSKAVLKLKLKLKKLMTEYD